jgi:hypothetical protein
VSILPYLKGRKPDEDPVDVLYWRYKGARAVRAGDWKWVSDPKEGTGLFDLSQDLGEQNNLTQSDVDRTAQLESLWRQWNRNNVAPLWQTKGLEMMRRAYGGEGMNAAPERRRRQGQPNKAPAPSDDQRSGRTADQSQNFKIDVFADHTDQWTGQRNTVWNSWYSHQAHGFAFLRDPDAWMAERWKPGELKNVRIMGGHKDPTRHHWMLNAKDGESVCDFNGLIEILGAERAQGLKPGIVLDQVPWEVAVRVAQGPPSAETMKYWNPKYGNDGPPADYALWKKYVRQFLKACIDAFGYEEVSRWQYRVATEPDNNRHWGGTWEEYIVHYDHTVQAVTEVIPNAWIGPGNFIASWLASGGNEHQLGTVKDFVQHCARGKNHATGEVGTRMTFLAFSVYSNSTGPEPNENTFGHEQAFKKARKILDSYPELNAYLDNDAMPEWFAIEVHEYGDLPSLGGEYLWMTEWMAGYHAHVLDLAYNAYGVTKTSFWFQNQGYGQWYPYIRVSQMLAEMESGTLVEVRKNTVSESEKVKYGAISAWKDGSLYVMIYNFNWDPLHQGTLRGKRTHTIDNTITLNISGKSIAAHPEWTLDHKIINEKSGNACWYYDLKAELDMHPDLDVRDGSYHVRMPRQRWKRPVEEITFSRGVYRDNGLHDRYEKLSQVGIVGTDIPVSHSGGKITFTSKPFTQSGVQLLKFTPVRM